MRFSSSYLSFACFMLAVSPTLSRLHNTRSPNPALAQDDSVSHNLTKRDGVPQLNSFLDLTIATSYEPKGGDLAGACGWNQAHPFQKIYGVALPTRLFAKGLSCGTCLEMTPKKPTRANPRMTPFKVVTVDECPGTCHGIDVQLNGILTWLGGPRVGQLDMSAKVVSCQYKQSMEIQQVTNSKYDLRLMMRLHGGAIKYAEVSNGKDKIWYPLVRSQSNQYTLVDGGASTKVFSGNTYSLRLTSYAPHDTITMWNIPYQPGVWIKPGQNFKFS